MTPQFFIGRVTGRLRRSALRYTDGRVRMMSEVLTCIKLIKMYAWENAFSAAISKLRVSERNILQWAGFLQVCVCVCVCVYISLEVQIQLNNHINQINKLTPTQLITHSTL